MRVICSSNLGRSLPAEYLEPQGHLSREREFPLTVGKQYVVYTLAFRKAQVWYYLSDDDVLYYPVRYPAPLFQVARPAPSKYWVYAYTPEHLDHIALFSFPEWSNDAYFYDRLTDKEEAEVMLFYRMKKLMDAEDSEDGENSEA